MDHFDFDKWYEENIEGKYDLKTSKGFWLAMLKVQDLMFEQAAERFKGYRYIEELEHHDG